MGHVNQLFAIDTLFFYLINEICLKKDTYIHTCYLTSTEGTKLLSAESCKFFWIGRTNTLPFPITLFSSLGDWAMLEDITSRSFEFGIHRRSSKPPQPFNFGNSETIAWWNSSTEQDMSAMWTFFSPKPASTRASLSYILQGIRILSLLLKQKNLGFQLFIFALHRSREDWPCGLGYGAKFALCSSLAFSPLVRRRSLTEWTVSNARLQASGPLWLDAKKQTKMFIDLPHQICFYTYCRNGEIAQPTT